MVETKRPEKFVPESIKPPGLRREGGDGRFGRGGGNN
jgi:hypothetical protein